MISSWYYLVTVIKISKLDLRPFQKLWRQSKRKLAILQNWRLDKKGRAHGELVFLGFTNKVVL